MLFECAVAALSDVGCVRSNNEDNFAYDPGHGLYVVCDGMGGKAAGEVASSLACSTMIETFAGQSGETPLAARLAASIRAANDAVIQSGQHPAWHGMGCTLVAAAVEGSQLLLGNVGDSRGYLLKGGTCLQITVDHSYANELVRTGTLKAEELSQVNLGGMESVITRAIGAATEVEPDFFAVSLEEGDVLLMASDGLTRYLSASEITELVNPADLDRSCRRLIEAAKSKGGADNITSLLFRWGSSPQEEHATETLPMLS